MVWAIVVVAIAVLGVAAWAGTGKLGEMPVAVTDRPKAHVPTGPVDGEFVRELTIPRVATGYRPSQVDALLAAHLSGADPEPDTHFDVVRGGYDMQAVDAVMGRMALHETMGTAEVADEHVSVSAPDESVVGSEEPVIDAGATPDQLSEPFEGVGYDGATFKAETNAKASRGATPVSSQDSPSPVIDDAR
ncbi:MAG: hypothetical protein ACTHU1_01825 [Arachnia sp.]